MKRPCIDCGVVIESGARCLVCQRGFQSKRKARGLTGQRGSTHRWRKLRRRALDRDGYRCVRCDAPYPLEVDHVNNDPNDDRLANLQVLCTSCHRDKHRRRTRPTRAELPTRIT